MPKIALLFQKNFILLVLEKQIGLFCFIWSLFCFCMGIQSAPVALRYIADKGRLKNDEKRLAIAFFARSEKGTAAGKTGSCASFQSIYTGKTQCVPSVALTCASVPPTFQ